MVTIKPVWYTYVSYETPGKLYIGYRKCPPGKTPETDSYRGSFKDKSFKPTGKAILGTYGSKKEALQAEIELHRINDVARNPIFANRSRQTSLGFSYNRSGEKLTEQHRKNISQAISGDNHHNYKTRHWYHQDYGIFVGSVSDLTRKFSYQNLSHGNLSQVALGRFSHYKGWKLLENKDVSCKHQRNAIKSWYHHTHGEFRCSAAQLIEKFSAQKLGKNHLSQVANKKRHHHKGWMLLENKNVERSKISTKSRRGKGHNWIHISHGTLIDVSCADLARIFTGENLSQSKLSEVVNKKRFSHKGWTILEE